MNRKKCEKLKILLESCKVTSKLSADSFMDSWDRLVPQKSNFKKKLFENVVNTQRPPPVVSQLRDMAENVFLGPSKVI